ncbi:DUF1636 family protein [Pseudanabaena sp. FACHB-2040]|uniref:DUF1636 domain-containing protein n=1 Tax=Pseudanabaena sp. FACHB-2040 TaxID=2692859 RepID=UPI001684581A|nr:DUF1636 family protein [Pseudanabaena sp. FACHB-2040]MBD2258234.1 DUF1636 family protein [Pseudanabaena sp. FACHB-2040]
MSKHLLIVCEACGMSANLEKSEGQTSGTHLLEQLKQLHQTWPRRNELALETTSCLCICDHPCAVALVGTHKPSYLFGDLSPLSSAADLLIASELYLDSEDGFVPAFQLPSPLRSCRIARIPPAP